MMVSYVSDAALLTKTFAEHQVKPLAFIGTSGGFADPTYYDLAGNASENYFDISTWEPDVNRPSSQEVNQKFKEKYGYAMNAEAVKAYVGCISSQMLWKGRVRLNPKRSGRPWQLLISIKRNPDVCCPNQI